MSALTQPTRKCLNQPRTNGKPRSLAICWLIGVTREQRSWPRPWRKDVAVMFLRKDVDTQVRCGADGPSGAWCSERLLNDLPDAA